MNNEPKLTIPMIVMLLVSLSMLSCKAEAVEYIEGDCIVIPRPVEEPVTVKTLL